MRKNIVQILIVIAILLEIVACSEKKCETGNINAISPKIAYCNGLVYISGSVILQEYNGAIKTIYDSQNDTLLGLTSDDTNIYFISRMNNTNHSKVYIGRIFPDGKVDCDITSEICQKYDIDFYNEIGYIRAYENKIFVSGAGSYGDAYLFDFTDKTVTTVVGMPFISAYLGETLYYTNGEYKIYKITLDELKNGLNSTIIYDGAIFSEYEKSNFYAGIGIEQLNVYGEYVYFSLIDEDGFSIYNLKADGIPEKIYTHDKRINEIVCYNGKVFFSDNYDVYCLTGKTVQFIHKVNTSNTEMSNNTEFAIHSGRLYYNLNDISEYVVIE